MNGAEPLAILLAYGCIDNEFSINNNLVAGYEYSNIRKLPLCQINSMNPLSMLLLIGKDVLQGPRNGR